MAAMELDPVWAHPRADPPPAGKTRLRRCGDRAGGASLFLFPREGLVRRRAARIVESKWFDRVILLLILVNSILLACYQYRAEGNEAAEEFNRVVDTIVDPILTACFTLELALKVVARGLLFGETPYLRDPWNVLDCVVVASALVNLLPGVDTAGLSWLRVCRALRPLRSLNAVPEMKRLVNTAVSSIPRLLDVLAILGILSLIIGIVGVTLMDGIFYRRCRWTPSPRLVGDVSTGAACWWWPYVEEEARLCGGMYSCQDTGTYCGGHDMDPERAFRPWGDAAEMGAHPWCPDSEPAKLVPETSFVHFDHIGGALLLVFQCMTLEGWTPLMYMVMDSYNPVFAVAYFLFLVLVTNSFLLNVALAVVDESLNEFDKEEERHQANEARQNMKQSLSSLVSLGNLDHSEPVSRPDELLYLQPITPGEHIDIDPGGQEDDVDRSDDDLAELDGAWLDSAAVRLCIDVANSEVFKAVISLCIMGNVVTMSLERFPAAAGEIEILRIIEIVFLYVFCAEMIVMIGAEGPKKYWTSAITAFDGVIVLVSLFQAAMQTSGPLTALRTLRLLRVVKKLASRWPPLRALLRSMLLTGMSLNYWLVLFSLMLFICALMFQTFFANQFHFADVDSLDEALPKQDWCVAPAGNYTWHFDRQECIPRAHFDTFLWSVVTVFQIMTGENWNSIMYAGMRGAGWGFFVLFVIIIFFGQILFLSLFLSMLMSKFEEVSNEVEEVERDMRAKAKSKEENAAILYSSSEGSTDEEYKERLRKNSEVLFAVSAFVAATVTTPDSPGGQSSGRRRGSNDSAVVGVSSMMASLSSQEAALTRRGFGLARWPQGYSLFVFSEENLLRRACRKLLDAEVVIMESSVCAFDSFILLCIGVNTLCLVIDDPLGDPRSFVSTTFRLMDDIFGWIFMFEMVVKLVAGGLLWGRDAYLRNPWNYLDGAVVIASIVGMLPGASDGSGLKTLRVLRAFRPLRAISRFENLRIVVQTMFKSLPDLGTLVVVSFLFLWIFGLFFLSYLSGTFYSCPVGDNPDTPVALLKDAGGGFATPLCLAADVQAAVAAGVATACPRGWYQPATRTWEGGAAPCGQPGGACEPQQTVGWARVSADTPICIGRCPLEGGGPEWLCPRRYETAEELPSRCAADETPPPLYTTSLVRNMTEAEQVGTAYVEAMSRSLVMPCGGSIVAMGVERPPAVAAVSCQSVFCPSEPAPELKESCARHCSGHPHFCVDVCREDSLEARCRACLEECEAACRCSDFCEPMIKDAALCHEQGLSWSPVLSQSFDNILSSTLTLFEILTTEGWVDVMYAAADATEAYMQPVRDNGQWEFAIAFSFYILVMFMFILNLGVGVIVGKFLELKKEGSLGTLTERQAKLIHSLRCVCNTPVTTVFGLTDLHLLPRHRRELFRIISAPTFDAVVMGIIVANTMVMAATVSETEGPPAFWQPALMWCTRVFSIVFLAECALKVYVLRWKYFADPWNRFDITSVVGSLVGIVIDTIDVMPDLNFSAVMSVFRILRLTRVFRLLKMLEGLNKVFTALVVSLVKLVNVALVLVLMLVLYGVLGVSLFAAAKGGETLDQYGNFRHFGSAALTLFRASTGEAWNELMHDLMKGEIDWFREGDWCTPADLYDLDNYDVLYSKCLIGDGHSPNACVQTIAGWNVLPVIYWVSYTLFITFMLFNLVVAVILEGYGENKNSEELRAINRCFACWRKRDRDHRMSLPLVQVILFINEAVGKDVVPVGRLDPAKRLGVNLTDISLRSAAGALDLRVSGAGLVHYIDAVKQVLRLINAGLSREGLKELTDSLETREVVQKMEADWFKRQMSGQSVDLSNVKTLRHELAATRMQVLMRERLVYWRRRARSSTQERHEKQCGSVPMLLPGVVPRSQGGEAEAIDEDGGDGIDADAEAIREDGSCGGGVATALPMVVGAAGRREPPAPQLFGVVPSAPPMSRHTAEMVGAAPPTGMPPPPSGRGGIAAPVGVAAALPPLDGGPPRPPAPQQRFVAPPAPWPPPSGGGGPPPPEGYAGVAPPEGGAALLSSEDSVGGHGSSSGTSRRPGRGRSGDVRPASPPGGVQALRPPPGVPQVEAQAPQGGGGKAARRPRSRSPLAAAASASGAAPGAAAALPGGLFSSAPGGAAPRGARQLPPLSDAGAGRAARPRGAP